MTGMPEVRFAKLRFPLRMLSFDFAAYVLCRCPGRSVRSRTGAGATRTDPGVDVDQAVHFYRDI
jgi:hypothetical protein